MTNHSPLPKAAPPPAGRIACFDGLRGVAAVIVVVFHYICLLHPTLTPDLSAQVHWLADTPVHILWNGLFSVSVFFVLSGFVMAAAADRRRGVLIASSLTRYLRLALPAAASCLLAWGWLSAFPDSAQALEDSLATPSRWLDYTYQHSIRPIWYAGADGLLGNFVRGYSDFNNVLWTMQVELLGSLGIFLVYALCRRGWARLLALLAAGAAVLLWLPDTYTGFLLGAALFEAHRRGLLRPASMLPPALALVAALAMGGMGNGAHLRLGLPDVPQAWELGEPRGIMSAVAAALLVYATLTLPPLGRVFARPLPVFLGRISFGLYLVHVPPLYTIVAWSYLRGVPEAVLFPAYAASVLLLAWLFTLAVDEPSLKGLSALRARLGAGRPLLQPR
ncbi:acyltransferase family protein [Roseomonas haemaphysalidis]|uniref:acyltransferase family protein n=1 Tax=Roseomonas haemaphysalidis TaxID=2768162 RepID=UPI001A9688A9|nr:acyltransferase [Roseomonas haemaphysalidis]